MVIARDPERSVLKVREHRKRARLPVAARHQPNCKFPCPTAPALCYTTLVRFPSAGHSMGFGWKSLGKHKGGSLRPYAGKGSVGVETSGNVWIRV